MPFRLQALPYCSRDTNRLVLKQTQFITVGRDTQLKVNDPRIQKKLKHLKMDFTIRSVFIFIR